MSEDEIVIVANKLIQAGCGKMDALNYASIAVATLREDVCTPGTILINRSSNIKYIPQVPKLKGVLWGIPDYKID